jgi:hypothetical protein
MAKRYFSINEAEDLLPSLSPLLTRAQALKDELDVKEQVAVRQRIMTDGSEESIDFDDVYDCDANGTKEEFYATVEKIEAMGAIIRDLDQGLIDFYTEFEGRDVFLSWRHGERKIRFWHEEGEGGAGRKRILELK